MCTLVTTSIVVFDRKESSEFDEEHSQMLHDINEDDDVDGRRQHPLHQGSCLSRHTKTNMEEVRRVRLLDQQAACIGHKVGMTAAKNLLTSLRGNNGDIG